MTLLMRCDTCRRERVIGDDTEHGGWVSIEVQVNIPIIPGESYEEWGGYRVHLCDLCAKVNGDSSSEDKARFTDQIIRALAFGLEAAYQERQSDPKPPEKTPRRMSGRT